MVEWCGWAGRSSWSLEPGARCNCEIELPRSRRQLLEDQITTAFLSQVSVSEDVHKMMNPTLFTWIKQGLGQSR